jgi:hypothetical protein
MMHLYNYCAPDYIENGARIGHCASRKLLTAPEIDFFHSPYEYLNRCFGGVHYSQHATDAITAAGKLHIDQIDTKTYLHRPPNTNAKTPWETWQILKRDVANSLTRNSHHYYYEMSVGCFRGWEHPTDWQDLTYRAPDISNWIARLTRLTQRAQAERPAPSAEVALVTSTEGHYVRRHQRGFSELYSNGFRQHVLPYIGAPFGDYLLETLDQVDRPHRLYLFPSAHYVPSPLRSSIRERLRAEGATAVWFYAGGCVDENGADPANIEALTGFRMRRHDDVEDFVQVDVTDFDHPITRGLEGHAFGACARDPGGGCTFGSDLDPEWFRARQEWGGFEYDREHYRFTPVFSVDDPEARVLGRLRGVDAPGLAVKTMDGWTSVFIAAPFPPWKLVSNLVRFAGGHLYSDRQDLVYANRRFVFLQANRDGRRSLALPRAARIADAFSGETVSENGRAVLDMRHGEVRAYLLDASQPGPDSGGEQPTVAERKQQGEPEA